MNMITYFNELVTKNFNNYLKKCCVTIDVKHFYTKKVNQVV